jgi:hypothetical protein
MRKVLQLGWPEAARQWAWSEQEKTGCKGGGGGDGVVADEVGDGAEDEL